MKVEQYKAAMDNILPAWEHFKRQQNLIRGEAGISLAKHISCDEDAPEPLKAIFNKCEVNYIGFDHIDPSADYMPTFCNFIYMSGNALIGIEAESSVEWESGANGTIDGFGDYHITTGADFKKAEEVLLDGEYIFSEKEWDKVVDYMVNIYTEIKKSKLSFDLLIEQNSE